MIGGQIKSMNPLQWGLLIILSIFWGGSFLFVGIAVEDFQPFTIAFLRVLIAGVSMSFHKNVVSCVSAGAISNYAKIV